MESKTGNQHILSFIEETLKKIEEIKKKVEELENNVKENPVSKKETVKEFDLVLSAVKKGLLTVDTLKDEYRNNKEIALEAIETEVINYKYLSDDLKNHYNITLKAVSICGLMLEYTSDDLKNNEEICKAALENDAGAIQFVGPDVIDKFVESVKSILKIDGLQLGKMPLHIQEDKIHCTEAVNQNIEAIKFVKCDELLHDKELFLNLVDKNGLLLEFACDELKEDFEVIITALSNNKDSKEFISIKVRERILSIFN